jgi:hypothetical protein
VLVLDGGGGDGDDDDEDKDAEEEAVEVVRMGRGFILGVYVIGVLVSKMEAWDTVCSRKQLKVRIAVSVEGGFL